MGKVLATPRHVLKIGPADATETRHLILIALKRHGPTTIAALARRLKLTSEAVRQHVVQLAREEWITPCELRERNKQPTGRPATGYCLTIKGDHLFPKHYDQLGLAMLESAKKACGKQAIMDMFAAMADEAVREWAPEVEGLALRKKVDRIQAIYDKLDHDTSVERSDGKLHFIERNCPFLNVALDNPVICSVTVNVLTRLLGCRVVRTERFQNGDGRCVFEISPEKKTRLTRFTLEPPIPPR